MNKSNLLYNPTQLICDFTIKRLNEKGVEGMKRSWFSRGTSLVSAWNACGKTTKIIIQNRTYPDWDSNQRAREYNTAIPARGVFVVTKYKHRLIKIVDKIK